MKIKFIGLPHHAKKLQHIDAVPLIGDNSINIEPPLFSLDESSDFIYTGSNDFEPALNLGDWKEVSSKFGAFWIVNALLEYKRFEKGFHEFITSHPVSEVHVLHENNFWGKIISRTCFREGVRCIAHQEGALRHLDQAYMNKQQSAAQYASELRVWTEIDRQAYIDAGVNPEKIVIEPAPHLWKYHQIEPYEKTLVIFDSIHWQGDFVSDVFGIQFAMKGWNIYVKTHPRAKRSGINSLFELDNVTYWEGDAEDAIAMAEMTISQHSTVLQEAFLMGRRVAEINFSGKPLQESWPEWAHQIDNAWDLHTVQRSQMQLKEPLS